jgi:hypothetical protein
MDTITKEKWAKTHKDYKMMRNGVPHILKMVNGATTLVPVKIVKETQTVSENFSSSDIDKIKGAVEGASSFMGIGAQLKKLGMKYDFSTSPLPVYMIKKGAKTFVLVNKKYAEKPDFVVGDTAGGLLEGKLNEGKDVKASTVKAGDKISLSDKYNPSGINTPFTVKSIDKKDGYIIFKGDSPKNVLKVKETSPVALHESKINEGNAFGAAVTKAKKEGLKEFEFNGKKYKVKKGSYEKNESAKTKETVTESIDVKYWTDYHIKSKKVTDKSKVNSVIQTAIRDWNSDADGDNQVDGTYAKYVTKLANEFFDKAGWLSTDVVSAMIMQE